MGARLAALMAGALLLSGCVPIAQPPAGPDDSEMAAINERMLDATWRITGLTGGPPAVEAGPATGANEWGQVVFSCMQQAGFTIQGFEYSLEGGAALGATSGDAVNDSPTQRAFYVCVAENPYASDRRDEVLSNEQLDYIYDYYLSWVVPCMVMNGFTPSSAPSREEFHTVAGQWSPYYSVDVGLSSVQYEHLEALCGAERPSLD